MQNTARFITPQELDYIRILFSKDKRSVGVELSDEKIEEKIKLLKDRMEKGIAHITMCFDESNNPVCMYVGFELPRISGWYIGLTKVIESTNHFSKTAQIMAPALELLIKKMESKGYFKFWMTAPEKHHNIRNKIIRKHSDTADRYIWFDETVIESGHPANIAAFDAFRDVCHWSDVVVRMFVLKQEHRIDILKQKNLPDYKGTLNNI